MAAIELGPRTWADAWRLGVQAPSRFHPVTFDRFLAQKLPNCHGCEGQEADAANARGPAMCRRRPGQKAIVPPMWLAVGA